MAQLLQRVEPGDVITADMWNLVVDAVNEILQSSQTGGIKVAAVVPAGTAAEPIRVGAPLQITGQSFGYALGQTRVVFEGQSTQVAVSHDQLLTGSSDTRLLLIVPPIPGLTAAGATMAMRVTNGVADDVRTVLVMPIVILLTGDMFVTWRSDLTNPSPNPLVPNQEARFNYTLESATNLPASFDLSAAITNSSSPIPAGLLDSIEFRNENNALIEGRRLDLGRSERRNVVVRIPQVPATWANQSFTLAMTSSAGGVTGTDSRSLTVGVPVPAADPNITVQATGATVLDVASGNPDNNPSNGRLDGSTIKLKVGKRMVVFFNVTRLGVQGIYDITIAPKDGTQLVGWAPQLANTPTPITVTVNNDQTTRLVSFAVTPAAGASATGTVVFKIKRRTATVEWSKEYGVELLP